MARSMTGFGQARGKVEGTHYAVEIRSVNGRYFKASIRLPEIWSSLEGEIEKRLRSRLNRGTVHFTVRMKTDSADAAYEVNSAAMERYIEQLEVIRPDQSDVSMTVDLAALLQMPGVVQPPEPDEVIEAARPGLFGLIDEAVDGLLAMRAAEGEALAADLRAYCDVMARHLAEIAKRSEVVVAEYHQRLKRRVAELTAEAKLKIDEQSLAREVAIFAERCDIAEEVSRLDGHLQQFRAVLDAEQQSGRKLEFISQEMLREANTMAAKGNDTDIANSVVDIKTAVDRIKEQLQNVE